LNVKYKTDIHLKFAGNLSMLHEAFIRFCLVDDAFSEDEVAQIFHLKKLFGLSDIKHNEIYFRVAEDVYQRNYIKLLADGNISEEKKAILQSLAGQLAIPDQDKTRINQAAAKVLMSARVDKILSDGELSPEDEDDLKRLSDSLGTDITNSADKARALNQAQLMWRAGHNTIPVVPVSINLDEGEKCYFECNGEWHENRTVTKSIGYAGPSLRIRIAKGISWKMGHYAVARNQADVLKKIDDGTLYLTNKRVLFIGQTRVLSIRLKEILDLSPYKEGLEIIKGRGRNPTFVIGSNIESAAIVLWRLIYNISH